MTSGWLCPEPSHPHWNKSMLDNWRRKEETESGSSYRPNSLRTLGAVTPQVLLLSWMAQHIVTGFEVSVHGVGPPSFSERVRAPGRVAFLRHSKSQAATSCVKAKRPRRFGTLNTGTGRKPRDAACRNAAELGKPRTFCKSRPPSTGPYRSSNCACSFCFALVLVSAWQLLRVTISSLCCALCLS